ncbi:hypothetical protein GDO86_011496 [Hymenochirus boettgeri]|uniref:Uncharacterized protein n=1 Tax=Hymenochirus boettgeri TaxID=247094 RepID=A0A8T2JGK1_9PIPI|nr:hypothetical protein GDO86_011496 [Hymenochirus boettgeri]
MFLWSSWIWLKDISNLRSRKTVKRTLYPEKDAGETQISFHVWIFYLESITPNGCIHALHPLSDILNGLSSESTFNSKSEKLKF